MLDTKIKKMIESDIELLNDAINYKKGSQSLYEKLTIKYNMIAKDFDNDIKTNGKARSLDEEFDYRPELKQVLEKLKMYLLLDNIPNKDDENKGSIIINAKNVKNKGVIGPNGSQITNKQTNFTANVNVNTDKKEGWLKSLIKRIFRKD